MRLVNQEARDSFHAKWLQQLGQGRGTSSERIVLRKKEFVSGES